uniref:Uncharacterized protein n=1 Tax=Plectus sambesii TaxID=2011161 RepID=A0A914VL86_9BILA
MPRSPAEQGDQERLWILHPQVLADSADDSHSTPPVCRRSLNMEQKVVADSRNTPPPPPPPKYQAVPQQTAASQPQRAPGRSVVVCSRLRLRLSFVIY